MFNYKVAITTIIKLTMDQSTYKNTLDKELFN